MNPRNTLVILNVVMAAALTSCGGSMRQVQGAQFELNAQEDELAEQWEQQEPRRAGLSARCGYWKQRTGEAMRDHAMGMLIWHANRFVTLREWANAKANQACTALAQQGDQKNEREAAVRQAGPAGEKDCETFCRVTRTCDRFDSECWLKVQKECKCKWFTDPVPDAAPPSAHCKKQCDDEVVDCMIANGRVGPAAQMCGWKDRVDRCLQKCASSAGPATGGCNDCRTDCAKSVCGVRTPQDIDRPGTPACLQRCAQQELKCRNLACPGF